MSNDPPPHDARSPRSAESGGRRSARPSVERSPRIAILGTRGVPARYGGFETFAEELGARLASFGVEVTVFCPRGTGPMPTEHRGVRLEYVDTPELGAAGSLLFDAACLWRARAGFDIVYMLGYGASPFCILPRVCGTRVWINMDGVEWKRSKWRGFARYWLKLTEAIATRVASRIVFDNGAVADEVRARTKSTGPVSVIEYGANVYDRERCEADGDAVLREHRLEEGGYYLAVARFEPENQIHEMITAFERVGTTRKLVIVTNAHQTSRYAKAMLALTNERVRIIGPVYDRAALSVLRQRSFASIHGHTVGGTNPSLLEALGCGSFVIAHGNPYNREVADESALYFDGVGELTLRIAECEAMTDADRIARAQDGRERVATHYSWERIARAYAALLGVTAGESRADDLKKAV